MFWREKLFHVKSSASRCRLSSRNLTYRFMAYLYASTVWGLLLLRAACSSHAAIKLNISDTMSFQPFFAVADKLSIYAPDVLKAIIDEDEDMVRLMNLNVKLREAA
jgi:hypothetical protein